MKTADLFLYGCLAIYFLVQAVCLIVQVRRHLADQKRFKKLMNE